ATWTQRSPGANGPVDFHQLAVSPVDPEIIYGAYGALQRSVDGGHEWSVVGPLPSDMISLAASTVDADTLYAGTRTGLHRSEDEGLTWRPVLDGAPVSLVKVTDDARIFAFIPGEGLAVAKEAEVQFSLLAADWGNEVLLHLAVAPENAERMFAASHQGTIFRSNDGGVTWEAVRGSPR
ncbi:WD40/YVTN/BNR-like repeat-containing protein, partial [Neoaquamicrobium microcysteis]|uniref:WD40/YVTN/BNR-like repeat-containing protein n=1 Tax=Neoaquamicrobium microcysteis TaxID=2682781 RepID=UPI0038B39540